MPTLHWTIGIDVGGTFIKSWVLRGAEGRPAHPPVETPQSDPTGERTADLVAALVGRIGADPVVRVGVAVPGIVDDVLGICRTSVNLGWTDVPVADLLMARLRRPVAVTQDVRAGAIAEKHSGAGAERPGSLLFVPLGTGLALAHVDAAGRPTASGWAGEIGQVRTRSLGAEMRMEEIASAGGVARRYGAARAIDVLKAVEAGDGRAKRIWREAVEALADLLASAAAILAPDTIVIGGGLALSGDALFGPLRTQLDRRLRDFPRMVVLPAAHGSEAAAIGAATLALSASESATSPTI